MILKKSIFSDANFKLCYFVYQPQHLTTTGMAYICFVMVMEWTVSCVRYLSNHSQAITS